MRAPRKGIDFVVKISKFCNLRCTYCYEFDELANKRRMSLDELRAFFVHVASAAGNYGRERIHFIWHGGEPLLIPLDYYERIGEMQREIFTDRIRVSNFVQTNLTVLTERHLTFLREKRFFAEGLGVSFDVCGDQRVDTRGQLKTDTVVGNMQRLKDAGITFGAITVLARNTLPRILEIFRFYESLGIGFRLLPFYKSAFESQVQDHSLSFAEITGALKAVFDAWWVSELATPVQPLDEYLNYALAVVNEAPKAFHDPSTDEQVFLVDTDGATYGQANTYAPDYAYGNVFRQDFSQLLEAPTRERVIAESNERLQTHCSSCPYFGHCPGTFAAEASAEQRRMLSSEGCQVRELVSHIVARLVQAEVPRRIAHDGDERESENVALSVA